jgi:flavin reductase (DIM6/NTAB) family NADH-FMN oxidoreductase RutF
LDLVCVASAKRRDTLDNIRETGEFVINLPGTDLSDKIVPTARYLPPEDDEFTYAGLEEHPSKSIKAPGVKGCYAWMECTLEKLYEEDQYVLIIGKVVRLEVDDSVYKKDGHLNVEAARPLMMTGSDNGMHFCTVKEIDHFEPYSSMFPSNKDPLAKMYK